VDSTSAYPNATRCRANDGDANLTNVRCSTGTFGSKAFP
jgi:hypothetical protein